MNKQAEVIKVLQEKGWYEELKNEVKEILYNADEENEEMLINLLMNDKCTLEQIKHLFKESIRTSFEYQMAQMLNGIK